MSGDRADERPDEGERSTLLSETTRVLDRQHGLIRSQQNQATRLIRLLLTAFGLLLTVVSLSLSSGVLAVESVASVVPPPTVPVRRLDVVTQAGALVLLLSIVLLGRVLYLAVAVVSPTAEPGAVTKALLALPTTPDVHEGPNPEWSDDPSEKPSELTPQLGISADRARELAESSDVDETSFIVDHHVTSIRRNEVIIERNRSRLLSMYTTIAVASFALGVVLILALSAILGPGR
jgi:hypothetical protein